MASPFARWQTLAGELRNNPWARTVSLAPGSRLRRRFILVLVLGLSGFAVSVSMCVSYLRTEYRPEFGEAESVLGGLIPAWFVMRAILMGRASAHCARIGRTWMSIGPVSELYLSSVTPREMVLGWTLAGWMRSLPEAAAAFLILYPWACLLGPAGIVIPWLELIVVVHFQFVAALVAANLTLKFVQRREAVSAGWISCTFVYPMVYVGRAALALLVLVPIGAMALGELVFFLAFAYLMIAYLSLMPFMALSEVRRQLELTKNYGEGLREWLSHHEKQSLKRG